MDLMLDELLVMSSPADVRVCNEQPNGLADAHISLLAV